MQNKYKKLAEKVISVMNERLAYLGKDPSYSHLEECAYALGCGFNNGATRCAFIFHEEKVVFKFPFYNRTNRDYCEMELEYYESAKDYGVEKILLPIYYMGRTAEGIPIYLQPMFTKPECELRYHEELEIENKVNVPKSLVDKVRRNCYDRSLPRRWTGRAIQIYGKKFMRKFERWTNVCEVNDLHSGNVGYLDRQPVIIDYAGYWD